MSNTYQKNRRRAQPGPVAGEVAVPEQVIVSMAEIADGHHDTGNAAVPARPPPGEAADASNHDQACLNSTSPEADWIGSVRVRGG